MLSEKGENEMARNPKRITCELCLALCRAGDELIKARAAYWNVVNDRNANTELAALVRAEISTAL